MTTRFHVLGYIDLRRVISARIELVFDDGTVEEVPALHNGDARAVAPRVARRPRAAAVPSYSRKVYRKQGRR